MTAYAALLRAINVGGTGKLGMTDLREICERCGFTDVTTYIQSGNVVFRSKRAEASVKKLLVQALSEKVGRPVGVFLRSAAELDAVLEHNPYADAAPNHVLVLFLDAPVPKGALDAIETPGGERLSTKDREIFIHYPEGMGNSRLTLPFQKTGTGRNLNTVRKLRALLAALESGGA
jgi:uncharacterized protein (DUF1697 family)